MAHYPYVDLDSGKYAVAQGDPCCEKRNAPFDPRARVCETFLLDILLIVVYKAHL